MDYDGNVVSGGFMDDTVTASSQISFVRYTNYGLETDRWFNLYIKAPSSNTATVAAADAMTGINVKLMQKYE